MTWSVSARTIRGSTTLVPPLRSRHRQKAPTVCSAPVELPRDGGLSGDQVDALGVHPALHRGKVVVVEGREQLEEDVDERRLGSGGSCPANMAAAAGMVDDLSGNGRRGITMTRRTLRRRQGC
jgi:hypothetical protein